MFDGCGFCCGSKRHASPGWCLHVRNVSCRAPKRVGLLSFDAPRTDEIVNGRESTVAATYHRVCVSLFFQRCHSEQDRDTQPPTLCPDTRKFACCFLLGTFSRTNNFPPSLPLPSILRTPPMAPTMYCRSSAFFYRITPYLRQPRSSATGTSRIPDPYFLVGGSRKTHTRTR